MVETVSETPSQKVLKFINNCFVPGSVTVKDCSLVPGGKIIRDKSGDELLIFWSIEYECLMKADLGGIGKRAY